MANPSLQIGNGKWAIKEDNLLGYSKAGTRFVPEPITMTRESAGTRVNSSGLVETVELLGSELVEDSNFPTPNTEWGTTLGWSIADNKASNDGTGGILRQTNTVPLNTKFKVVFTVADYVTGNIQIKFAPIAQTIVITGDATYTIYTDGNNSVNGDLQILATSSFQGSITNVSVKEVTKNNLARVDYDGTASSLLVEPMRTNLIPYSEDFTVGNWAKTRCTVTSNQATSPDGTLNADLMTSTDDDARLGDQVGSSGAEFTQSIYVKSAQVSDVNCQIDFAGLNTVTFTANQQWQRVETTLTDTSQSPRLRLRILNSGNSIYVWGGQVEVGSYPTSDISTSGDTVTRVKDQYSKTGISDLINSTEGVLFVEGKGFDGSDNSFAISLNDGSSTNRIFLSWQSPENTFRAYSTGGGNVNFTGLDVNSNSKVAVRYSLNNFSLWVDGEKRGEELTYAGIPADTLNKLSFDRDGAGELPFYGKVKQLQVYDTALSDDELTILTGTSGVHFYPSYAAMASVLTYKI